MRGPSRRRETFGSGHDSTSPRRRTGKGGVGGRVRVRRETVSERETVKRDRGGHEVYGRGRGREGKSPKFTWKSRGKG